MSNSVKRAQKNIVVMDFAIVTQDMHIKNNYGVEYIRFSNSLKDIETCK